MFCSKTNIAMEIAMLAAIETTSIPAIIPITNDNRATFVELFPYDTIGFPQGPYVVLSVLFCMVLGTM